jgi:hypothetical protein
VLPTGNSNSSGKGNIGIRLLLSGCLHQHFLLHLPHHPRCCHYQQHHAQRYPCSYSTQALGQPLLYFSELYRAEATCPPYQLESGIYRLQNESRNLNFFSEPGFEIRGAVLANFSIPTSTIYCAALLPTLFLRSFFPLYLILSHFSLSASISHYH